MERELQREGEWGRMGGARRGEGRCSATQLELERTPRAQPSACCHRNQIPPPTCIPTDWLPLSLLLSLSLFSCLCCIFLHLSYAFSHITWQKCVCRIRQSVYAMLEMRRCWINNAKYVFGSTKESLSAFRTLSMIRLSHSQSNILSYPPSPPPSPRVIFSPVISFSWLHSFFTTFYFCSCARFFYSSLFSTPTTSHHVHTAAKYGCYSCSESLILFCTHTARLGEWQPQSTTKFILNKVVRSELHELLMTYLKTHQNTKNSSHTVWLN